MKLKNNGDTPQKLIREALQASAKVDDLEAANASQNQIDEIMKNVRQISQLISQLHQKNSGIISDADYKLTIREENYHEN